MDPKASIIEGVIDEMAKSAAQQVNALATGDFIREGVLKQFVTAFVWALYEEIPDQREALADILENWPELVREAIAQEGK